MGKQETLRGMFVSAALACIGACGGGTPAPSDPSAIGGASAKSAQATSEYTKCKAEENKEGADASRIQRCYQGWLDEYRDSADAGQLRHAQRMSAPTPGPVSPGPPSPKPDDEKEGPPKPIVIDEHAPAMQKNGGGDNPFPPQTVGYGECWKDAPLTGNYVTDYNNLIARCGKPTGMLPYSRVTEGELSDKNKGDVFTVKLVGGACYRIFAVAGGTIKDLDIGLATMEGKMLAADKYTQPVAIIDWQKPVCVDSDVEFKFIVARDGAGEGGYGFGVWFKPAG